MTRLSQQIEDACILTSGLTKRFGGRTVVDGLDLAVGRGQTFGFLGPNGAGKSTTIRMLLGLIRPSAGAVNLLGHDVQLHRLRALRGVGAMVETPSFYGYLTGLENIRIFGRLGGTVSDADIAEALEMVGLAGRAGDRVKTYSHGMKQRLGIACALVPRPELVVLDEPTNGLDPAGVREIRELVKRLSAEHGMTVFLSSHLLYEVEQTCTHVAVIARGRLLAQGSVEDLLGRSYGPVEFETDRPAEASRLLERELQLKTLWMDDDRFAVTMPHSRTAECNRILVEAGFSVSGIERRRQSLEDFYLGLMREEAGRA